MEVARRPTIVCRLGAIFVDEFFCFRFLIRNAFALSSQGTLTKKRSSVDLKILEIDPASFQSTQYKRIFKVSVRLEKLQRSDVQLSERLASLGIMGISRTSKHYDIGRFKGVLD